MIDEILHAGGQVSVYDPVATEEAKRRFGDKITYNKDIYEASLDADAIIVVTEWKEFRLPSWQTIKKIVKTPLILDGRNIYDKQELEDIGFIYCGIGR